MTTQISQSPVRYKMMKAMLEEKMDLISMIMKSMSII